MYIVITYVTSLDFFSAGTFFNALPIIRCLDEGPHVIYFSFCSCMAEFGGHPYKNIKYKKKAELLWVDNRIMAKM